jgi:hypothetical protein
VKEDSSVGLKTSQVGLGQSRGYLSIKEIPEGSAVKKWCVLR